MIVPFVFNALGLIMYKDNKNMKETNCLSFFSHLLYVYTEKSMTRGLQHIIILATHTVGKSPRLQIRQPV